MTRLASAALLLALAATATAQPTSVVVPASASASLGGSSYGFPFSYTNYVRFQQVIDPAVLPGPMVLWGLSLRVKTPASLIVPDPAYQGLTVTLADSTATSTAVTGNFAQNVGTNALKVFDGVVAVQRVNPTDPREFNVTVAFSQPYVHTNANPLLIDMVPTSYMGQACNGGGNGTSFDAAAAPGMAVVAGKGSCGAPPNSGGSVQVGLGYVIQFFTAPVAMGYGLGCPGSSGVLTTVGNLGGASTLGNSSFLLTLSGVPAAASGGFFVLGLSNLAFAGGGLPFPLAGYGLPACYLHADLGLVLGAILAGGQALQPLPIPNALALQGLDLFGQWLIADGGAPGGAFASQGVWVKLR